MAQALGKSRDMSFKIAHHRKDRHQPGTPTVCAHGPAHATANVSAIIWRYASADITTCARRTLPATRRGMNEDEPPNDSGDVIELAPARAFIVRGA